MESSRLRHSTRALFRTVGDEVLVTRIDDDDIERLSGSAGVIWKLLAAPRSEPELVSLLEQRYGKTETLANDARELLRDLLDRRLLEVD
jgi:Coenzyme PQQ synthesis protein D (PqqD)